MGVMLPADRPRMNREDVEKIIAYHKIDRTAFPVCVVAVRGYYQDTMGVPGENDRGIYDDGVAVCTPNVFATFNWNTDASTYRKGTGKGAEKGMAMLAPGVWSYQIGAHKGRAPAGVQAAPVTVMRDQLNGSGYADTGYFGINIHWGGVNTTGSDGCQTAPPDQFPGFIGSVVSELKRCGVKVFKYILITESTRKFILNGGTDRSLSDKVSSSVMESVAEAKKDIVVVSTQPAIDIIKRFEGFVPHAYRDSGGVWTIGYGTTSYPSGQRVKQGETVTQAVAEGYLHQDLAHRATLLGPMINVPLNPNEVAALLSFVYNVGLGGPDDAKAGFYDSTMRQKLNAGRPKIEVADEFLRWIKSNGHVLTGLVLRRQQERELFLSPSWVHV